MNNQNENKQESEVTLEQLNEAHKTMDHATTQYWYLKNLYEKQKHPDREPQGISEILDKHKEEDKYVPSPEAIITKIEDGFTRIDEGSHVVDLITDSNGVVWTIDWKKTTKEIPAAARETYDTILERYKGLDWNQASMKEIKWPCPTAGCNGWTWQMLRDLRHLRMDNYQHELVESFFCKKCASGSEFIRPLIEQWMDQCPKAFQQGDTKTRIDLLPKETYEAMKEWGNNILHSNKSLYVFGRTGTCKSRMMWLILYHCVAKNGLTFKVYNGGDYRDEQLDISSTRYDRKPQNRLSTDADKVDVVVFDDFGQDALTESMMSELWNLIDNRLSNGKRMVFLSNFPPDALKPRYSSVFHMDSMIRRLEDFCTLISSN